MNKKLVVVVVGTLAAGALFARPHGGPRGGFCGPRMCAPVHHHHHSGWGRGGRNFWPGFVGGLVGGVVANTVVRPTVYRTPTVITTTPIITTPVVTTPVVTTPVVTTPVVATTVYTPPATIQTAYATQQVWVPGVYVDQTQPNGTVVRVWQPGHYETRSVPVL